MKDKIISGVLGMIVGGLIVFGYYYFLGSQGTGNIGPNSGGQNPGGQGRNFGSGRTLDANQETTGDDIQRPRGAELNNSGATSTGSIIETTDSNTDTQ